MKLKKRQELFEKNKKIAANVASSLKHLMPLGYSMLELQNIALAGIWDATRTYKKSKATFEKYAFFRARGYVLDTARAESNFSRQAQDKGVRLINFSSYQTGLTHTEDQTHQDPIVDNPHVRPLLHGTNRINDHNAVEAFDHYFCYVTNERQRRIAWNYFVEGLHLKDIASIEKVDISYISFLLSKITNKIREKAKEDERDSELTRPAVVVTLGDVNNDTKQGSPGRKPLLQRSRGVLSQASNETD